MAVFAVASLCLSKGTAEHQDRPRPEEVDYGLPATADEGTVTCS